MDLLLTHGHFLEEEPRPVPGPYPPLGILSLTSYLQGKGFAVEVFDSTFSSFEALANRLESTPPSNLCVHATVLTGPSTARIIRRAKSLGWRVIAEGPAPAAQPQDYLDAGADLVLEDEDPVALEEILSGEDATSVRGVHLLDEAGVAVSTGARTHFSDPDAHPPPAREQIDIQQYLNYWKQTFGKTSLNLITQCGESPGRRRSPDKVADEAAWLMQRYCPDQLWFADDVFAIDLDWLERYADEAGQRNLAVPVECTVSADCLDDSSADALARLGATRVWIGSENTSQEILDPMRQGAKTEHVRRAVELLRERGIETGVFLTWGGEGEHIEDIEAAVAQLESCLPDVFVTNVVSPVRSAPRLSESPVPSKDLAARNGDSRGRRSKRFYSYADMLLESSVKRRRMALAGHRDSSLDRQIDAARQALHVFAGDVEP